MSTPLTHPNLIPAVGLLLALAACSSHVRVLDGSMAEDGEILGASSAALVITELTATETTLQQRVGAVGDDLIHLVIEHDASSAPGSVPDEAAGGLTDGELTSWDGEFLTARSQAGAVTYDVDLRVDTDAVRHLGHEPFVDQTVDLLTTVPIDGTPAEVRIHARYVDLTLDGEDCAAGGGIDASYRISGMGEERGGYVRSSYHGCGRIEMWTRDADDR